MTGTEDPDVVTTYRYTPDGYCSEVTTADRIETYKYDVMGNTLETHVYSPENTLLAATCHRYDLNNHLIYQETANPNHTLTFSYNAAGLVKSKTQTLASSDEVAYTLYDYDTRNNLIEEINPRNHSIHRGYDRLNRLTTLTEGECSTYFTYEPGGFIASATTPSGAITKNSYTTNGLLKTIDYPDGTKDQTTYDIFGRPTQETKSGITWKITYNDVERQITRTHIDSETTEIETYNEQGNLIFFQDGDGFITETHYDGLGRVKNKLAPDGLETKWSYDGNLTTCYLPNGERRLDWTENGHIVETQIFDSSDECIYHSTFSYDPKTDTAVETVGEITTTTTFNALHQPLCVQRGDVVTTYLYDLAGNCIAITDGEKRTIQQAFDLQNRLTTKTLPDGAELHYQYDSDSNLIQYTLPNASEWHAKYDGMGRKITETLKTTNQTAQHWTYTYENDRLKTTTDPLERTHSYGYDTQGRLIKETIGESYQRTYAYNHRGLLQEASEKTPSHLVYVNRHYDSQGRLADESISLDNQLIQQTVQNWTATDRTLTIGDHERSYFYQNGQLVQIANAHVNLDYSYDLGGNLIHQATPSTETTIAFDDSGLPSYRSTPGITQESLGWDCSGKLLSRTWNGSATHYSYSPRGQLKAEGNHKYQFDFGSKANGIRTQSPHHYIPEDGIDPFGKVIKEVRTFPNHSNDLRLDGTSGLSKQSALSMGSMGKVN